MKKLVFFIVLFTACILINQKSLAQTGSAGDQCLIGKGVNILGYDNAFWKDHSKGRFKETYFKMIKDAGFCWAYWQFDADFIVYNIDKEQWVKPILDALMNRTAK